ncbi:unnamed protein product, partial [Symbiodinium sp. CCMP2456]
PALTPQSMGPCSGGDVLSRLQRANSTDSGNALQGGETKKKPGKVNPHAITKKVNTKIQTLAGKLTEVMIWGRKVAAVDEADLLLDSMCEKTKEGYQEQLQKQRVKFLEIKGALEGLYSLHHATKDVDLPETVKDDIEQRLQAADNEITNFT